MSWQPASDPERDAARPRVPVERPAEAWAEWQAKGADYQSKLVVGRDFVESYGGRVELGGLAPGYSSTDLINKLQRSVA